MRQSRGPAGPARPLARAKRPARFAVVFGGCFLLGVGVLLIPSVHAVVTEFSSVLVRLCYGLIRFCGGTALAVGPVLSDPASGFAVEMRDGCNAVNVTLLLWSAMVAFPAAWRPKAMGLVAGSLIIQALNVVRFISLFYLGQYSRTWFDFAHGYLWETLLVLDAMVIFWLWVSRVSGSGTVGNAGE